MNDIVCFGVRFDLAWSRSAQPKSRFGWLRPFLSAWIPLVIGLFMLATCESVWAQDVGRVQTKLQSKSPVWVGQKVDINVDLLSPTFFSGAPDFAIPDVPGMIIMKASGSPVVSSTTVDGDSWSVQRHSFFAYAHRPGQYEIPAFRVRFSVAPKFGQPPIEQRLSTQPVSFAAKLPAGAEGVSLLISTDELTVEEVWNPIIPDDGKIEVSIGDAITRTIKLVAADVPGMALPPIRLPEPEGLSAYPNKPIVADIEDRGSLRGERTDSTTFICEVPGEYQLPAVTIPWLNTETEVLEKVKLSSVKVIVLETVSGKEALQESEIESENSKNSPSYLWAFGLLTLAAMGGFTWFKRDRIRSYLETDASRAKQKESILFKGVLSSCASNRPAESFNSLMRWLEFKNEGTEIATVHAWVDQQQDPKLTKQLELLQKATADPKLTWSGAELADELIKVRKRKSQFSIALKKHPLSPLNPPST